MALYSYGRIQLWLGRGLSMWPLSNLPRFRAAPFACGMRAKRNKNDHFSKTHG